MQQRALGALKVGAIGLGAMPMSLQGRPERGRAIATIHAAIDAGVTLIDTANAYCCDADDTGHNERLIAEALRSRGSGAGEIVVATKGGHVRDRDGGWHVNGRPEHLIAACEASLRALRIESIPLYQFHRPDPAVPFADSVGALADLLATGKIQMAGLSNVTVDQIDEARSIVPVASVQNQFSPAFRSSLAELEHCGRSGLAFLPWSPLGGIGASAHLAGGHAAFGEVARQHAVSPQRVALAWALAKGDHVLPIPGASRPGTIIDSAAASDLVLSEADLSVLDR